MNKVVSWPVPTNDNALDESHSNGARHGNLKYFLRHRITMSATLCPVEIALKWKLHVYEVSEAFTINFTSKMRAEWLIAESHRVL